MTRPRLAARAGIALLLTAISVCPLTAESLETEAPRFFQIRTTDRRIAAALDEGLRDSQTFRHLASRVNTSDVVVYVVADNDLPRGVDGRLTFLSNTGGFRYVVVKVNPCLSMPRLVSLIGHELQHAREVADTGTIIDDASLGRAYAVQLGFTNQVIGYAGRAYDSEAAVRAGETVLREVLAAD
jgi:hypothetical protein